MRIEYFDNIGLGSLVKHWHLHESFCWGPVFIVHNLAPLIPLNLVIWPKGAPLMAMFAYVFKLYFFVLPLPRNIDFRTKVPDAASVGVVEHHEVGRSKKIS